MVGGEGKKRIYIYIYIYLAHYGGETKFRRRFY